MKNKNKSRSVLVFFVMAAATMMYHHLTDLLQQLDERPVLVLLNGPPGSGKDTLAKALVDAGVGIVHEYKKHLFDYARTRLTRAEMAEIDRIWGAGSESHRQKDEPNYILGGCTPRQKVISVSTIARGLHGDNVFSLMFLREAQPGTTYIVPDVGYDSDYWSLTTHYHVLVVRLSRDGCTFANDSRKYLDGPRADDVIHLHNSDMQQFIQEGVLSVQEWIAKLQQQQRPAVAAEPPAPEHGRTAAPRSGLSTAGNCAATAPASGSGDCGTRSPDSP